LTANLLACLDARIFCRCYVRFFRLAKLVRFFRLAKLDERAHAHLRTEMKVLRLDSATVFQSAMEDLNDVGLPVASVILDISPRDETRSSRVHSRSFPVVASSVVIEVTEIDDFSVNTGAPRFS